MPEQPGAPSGQKGAWGVIRRFPVSDDSYGKVLKFLKNGPVKVGDLPGRAFGWAHAAPLKLGRAKHGKVVVLAQEGAQWKTVVPRGGVEDFCRDALLNPSSTVPLSRDSGYHAVQKESVGISRRAFYAFLQKQEALQVTRNRPNVMLKPGVPLASRGNLELDLVEAKGKDIGKFLHHPVKDFYFVTLVDRLTGWFEVGRALHKDAKTISGKLRTMLKRMARALGIPPSQFYLRSDSGSEFKAETQEVFKILGLRHKFVKSGNRIEKVNQDFQRTWYRLMRLGRGDLEELDQQAAAITNNLLSQVTGKTPMEALEAGDAELSAEFNKHRRKTARYKAPAVRAGDLARYVVTQAVGKHGRGLAYKTYRGKHWSDVLPVVKINTGGHLTKFYIGGKWRFRDDIMLVPAVDAQTKAKVAQREFI